MGLCKPISIFLFPIRAIKVSNRVYFFVWQNLALYHFFYEIDGGKKRLNENERTIDKKQGNNKINWRE